MQVNPYLNFNGDAREALAFYEKALGGKSGHVMTFGDTPSAEHVPADWGNKVMHASLELPGGNSIFLSDAPPGMYEKPAGTYVSINVDEAAEAERIFGELAQNGQVQMPLEKTFWAERFGMVVDRFGIPWMLNCEGKHAS